MFSASKTAGPSGYTIQRSVRLRSSASAYFSRTPASATNRKTWTWSGWVKRGALGSAQALLEAGNGTGTYTMIWFTSSDQLQILQDNGAGGVLTVTTNAVFRDPSSWYHVVVAVDTTQATSNNRTIFYVNGVNQSLTYTMQLAQNADTWVDYTYQHRLGGRTSSGSYLDGYLTEINFIDGQALTPTSFGAYNATTGVWQPKAYTGTYGTNGFFVNFRDNTSTTTLGYDYSGNSNNWTANNVSLTAGATYDSMTDVPTLTSSTNANFAVMNPIVPTGASIISGGNLNIVGVVTYCNGLSTINLDSGSYYAECVVNTHVAESWGVWDITKSAAVNSGTTPSGFYGIYSSGATLMSNGTNVTTNAAGTPANGDIVQVAWNNGKVWLGKNNTWYDSSFGTTGNPSAGTNATFTGLTVSQFAFIFGIGNGAASLSANFGQRPFVYTPPTGYNRLNTYNLATPTIPNGAAQFAATTYTGNGSTQSITNTVNGKSFQPDFVWIKDRSFARDHRLVDSVRGNNKELESNTTDAEFTETQGITAFNTNGFSVGTTAAYNNNTETFVGWQWKASNATAVSNTSGSITSSVSANPTAGFSIVTYTGTGANATVGHGLGIAPKMVIVKNRTTGATDWCVWHTSVATIYGSSYCLFLELTNNAGSYPGVFNSTAPTSSVFSIGTSSGVNTNTNNYVAYCFSEIAGYSKFGSYTGTGNTDGAFVYTGFRPRWIMTKQTGAVSNWSIHDTSRAPYNLTINELYADTSDVEYTGTNDSFDLLSNGFKPRSAGTPTNASGGTYIYVAFAENPFNYSLAR